MTRKQWALIGISALALALGASGDARAGGNLVVNGNFEDTYNVTPPDYPPDMGGGPGNPGVNGYGQLGYNTVAVGWSSPDFSFASAGYNFIFSLPSADSFGQGSPAWNLNLILYGPDDGYANGLTASPVGGQFVGADGDTRYNGPIEQTINGLTAGGTYRVGFWWAGAQQYGAGGTPNEQWQVSLGGQTQLTPNMPLPSVAGFTGWTYQTMDFTATSASEVLSFLATEGGPFGGPPFLLLDGVTMQSVPEPGTMVLMGLGLLGAGAVQRMRRRARSVAV